MYLRLYVEEGEERRKGDTERREKRMKKKRSMKKERKKKRRGETGQSRHQSSHQSPGTTQRIFLAFFRPNCINKSSGWLQGIGGRIGGGIFLQEKFHKICTYMFVA